MTRLSREAAPSKISTRVCTLFKPTRTRELIYSRHETIIATVISRATGVNIMHFLIRDKTFDLRFVIYNLIKIYNSFQISI